MRVNTSRAAASRTSPAITSILFMLRRAAMVAPLYNSGSNEGEKSLSAALDEFEFFLDKEWSDGFPVVTPTEERVQRMLHGTRRDPQDIVAHVPPAGEVATVRTVAVHALMAGCKPEYLPVVLGGLELIAREE